MLFDTHCHLQHPRFDADRQAVLHRALAAGIEQLVVPAITTADWEGVLALCGQEKALLPALGIHPMAAHAPQETALCQLEERLAAGQATAVGECGLDPLIDPPGLPAQRALFDAQLALAARYHLPVVIHARKATEAVSLMLRNYPGIRGVLHSFSGSYEQAKGLIDRGFLLGFGGPVTSPHATRLHRLVTRLPLDALLLESDAPDQPSAAHQRERNEPAFLGEVCETIATLRKQPCEAIAEATTRNAKALFLRPQEV